MSVDQPLRVVSWNIGQTGLRTALASARGGLPALLHSLNADVICFQETKVRRQELEREAALAEGWDSFFSHSQDTKTGYSGVATFVRAQVSTPVQAEDGFTGARGMDRGIRRATEGPPQGSLFEGFTWQQLEALDGEGRCVITDHGPLVILNVYGPAVCSDDERGEERQAFKMAFWQALLRRVRSLVDAGRNVILLGDLNISPEPIDRPDPGDDFLDRADRRLLRSAMTHTCAAEGRQGEGWLVDAFRLHHPGRRGAYTCWSAATSARTHNWGSRIDHILVASGRPPPHQQPQQQPGPPAGTDFASWVVACDIWPDMPGSDHCPIWAHLRLPAGVQLPVGGPAPRLASSCRFKGKQLSLKQLFNGQGQQPGGSQACSRQAGGAQEQQPGSSSGTDAQEGQAAALQTRQQQPQRLPGRGSRAPIERAGSGSSSAGQKDISSFFGAAHPRKHQRPLGQAQQLPLQQRTDQQHAQQHQQPPPAAGAHPAAAVQPSSGQQPPAAHPAARGSDEGSGGASAGSSQGNKVSKEAARAAFQQIADRHKAPMCHCREPSVLRVSKTKDNPGRLFYVCARPVGPKGVGRCEFFQWGDKRKGPSGGGGDSAKRPKRA